MSPFKLDYRAADLKLRHAFTISRGTRSHARNVFLRLRADGITGYGEAAPNSRYGEDPDGVARFLGNLPEDFFDEVTDPDTLLRKLDALPSPVKSATAAIEMAWLDWWGKKEGVPLWELWGYTAPAGPVTSFTIGLDEPGVMQRKVSEAEGYPVLKVKLGTDGDRDIIRAIREVTDKPLRVDANEGWTSPEQAKKEIGFLAGQNVELVEQPMPAGRFDDLVRLKEWSPVPLCADESFEGGEDLEKISTAFDAVNIKLMKTGSLLRARRYIAEAKSRGLDIMIGCMIESSLANSAAVLLGQEARYADVDSHLLIENDPFEGLELDESKRVSLSGKPGLGARLKESTLFEGSE